MSLNSSFPYTVWQRRAAVIKPTLGDTEKAMTRHTYLFALVPVLLHGDIASAQDSQYPIMEKSWTLHEGTQSEQ